MEKQTKNLGEQMSWEFWPVSAEFDNMYETLRGNQKIIPDREERQEQLQTCACKPNK